MTKKANADCSALLINAPVGRHFAQLHRDSATRAESIRLFVSTGLERGNGVLVVAAQHDIDKLLDQLDSGGHHPEERRRSGQLALLDSRSMLGQFMRDGTPDWRLFRDTVGAALTGLQAHGQSSTRAYGDMVNLLWREGRVDAAIRLEEYWNELARIYPFSLFCGYMLDGQHEKCYQGPLHEIGRTHSEILSSPEDELFGEALDRASRDVFGRPASDLPGWSTRDLNTGESRLPLAQQKMLFIMRTHPTNSTKLLNRARQYVRETVASAAA